MPHHKSCIKRMRTSEEERTRNRAYRSQAKKVIKKIRESGNRAEAEAALREAVSLLDHIANKGIIHKNKAANYKSKLTKRVSKLPA
ncbi:MAG: 30S ribosomal protein S20 [bacterium]